MNHPHTMQALAGLHQADLRAEAARARLAREARSAKAAGHRGSSPALRHRRLGVALTAMLLSFGAVVGMSLTAI